MTEINSIVGRGIFDVFPDNPDDDDADGVSNLSYSLRKVLETKAPHVMAIQKYDIQRPDGSFEVRYWSPFNIPVLDEHNEVDYIIHRVKDVSELVVLQNEQMRNQEKNVGLEQKIREMDTEIIKRSQEIQKLNTELEKKVSERTAALRENEKILENQNEKLVNQNRELQQFTYITSHDLQEPLRSLVSFTELLDKEFNGQLNDRGNQYVKFISKSAKRMQEMVRVFMDYSRIGRVTELTSVNCNVIIQEVLSDISLLIKETKAELTIEPLPTINGYEVELRQLFLNLINNAIKFRTENNVPQIKITCREEDEVWLFSLADNGIGISESDINKLFVIFKRLHNRDKYEGTGIGLAHCQKVVELHGGRIWAESKEGKGCTFKFTIPK